MEFVKLDWDFLSAVGTGAAAIAAIASWITAIQSLKLQKSLASLEQRKFLYESLKGCAEKANSYSKGKKGADWDFHDAANIVRCLNLAMNSIQSHAENSNLSEAKGLKQFFISQLNMELFEELNYEVGPDAFFRAKDLDSMTSEIYSDWMEAIAFFNFKIVTDKDLED